MSFTQHEELCTGDVPISSCGVHKSNGRLVSGSFCEQYLDLWEGDVPCQQVCTVLLPPCLCLDPYSHCCGQAPGESSLKQRDGKLGGHK